MVARKNVPPAGKNLSWVAGPLGAEFYEIRIYSLNRTTTLTYDSNGNLTSDGTNTYVWDARNRLVSISGGVTASFKYDALGRRTIKVVGSAASQFLYDGNDIAAEIGGGAVGASYLRSLTKMGSGHTIRQIFPR